MLSLRSMSVHERVYIEKAYLSQAAIRLRVAKASAMDTRFFSPPDTPRTAASPTKVFLVWLSPKTVKRMSTIVWIYSSLDAQEAGRLCGARVLAANSRVWPTVKVGK